MSDNQKGSALVGGALTDETLASTHSVLSRGTFGGQKGLQQWYSPPEAARLVRAVIDGNVAVLDPTAGDGMLLSEFPTTLRYGIEIDADQIKNAKAENRGYHALKGDLQHVYTLLSKAVPSWDAIVANPPFGLQWSDPSYRDGKATNSTVLTFIYISRLLAEDGQYAFICGRDRFHRQITKLPESSGIYAVVECDELFEGTGLPCAIVFGVHPGYRSQQTEGFASRSVPLDMLDLTAQWVKEERSKALGAYNHVSGHTYAYDRPKQFEHIQDEYNRRLEGRTKANREYDALLFDGGKKVQWFPSAFAQIAIKQRGGDSAFYGLNGMPITYFAQNDRVWNMLLNYEADGIITLEPKLVDAVEQSLVTIRRERVPMYRLKPQQRLGFLPDIEFLRCRKSDPERGFSAGEMYRIDAKPADVTGRFKQIVESKKTPGEFVEKSYETIRKALHVRIGHFSFHDSGEEASVNIQWLIDHFDLPDPGDVETKHPEEIAAAKKLVREVMDEFAVNSAKWEEKNPTAMPFTIRDFQVEDIARLVFKDGGMLSWEQGLGKTLGALAFISAQWKLGYQKCALVVTPNDLIDQWTRESQRFLGMTPTFINKHGQAVQIARDLKRGGEGLFITDYSKMSITGTRGNNVLLPPVTVREWTEPRKVKGTGTWGDYFWAHNESEDTPLDEEQRKKMIEEAEMQFIAVWMEKYDWSPDEHQIERGWSRFAREAGYIMVPCEHGHPMRLYGHIPERMRQITKRLTSRDLCPQCEADLRSGWTGAFCESKNADGSVCGYSHYAVKMKPIASRLSTAFSRGVLVYDEIQMIQSKALAVPSKRSKALVGVRSGSFLGMTGTPIKNYIDQAFWPLWKSLGNATVKFPYDYEGGQIKFAGDYCVTCWDITSGRKESRGFTPEVSNLSLFWRLLASSTIRRRKEETGEKIVPKYYHEIQVPLGLAQAEQIAEWLLHFPDLFEEKYPDKPIVKAGMHRVMPATLGLNWKLDYACTLPEQDPDADWTEVSGISNYTPANLQVLRLAMALVKDGRKVLIGSNLKSAPPWFAEKLRDKGVNALDIVDEQGETVDADERAELVYDFQTNPDVQVFCAGTSAIRLGHNLDQANAVILHGLDFDYETLDQFLARIHRLTSREPVDVFIILPTLSKQDTITTRKWQLLGQKGGTAELALDGRLIIKNEHRIDENQMLRDLMERGLVVTDEAVDEVSVQEDWEALPTLENFDVTGIIPERPADDDTPTEQGGVAAEAVGRFLRDLYAAIHTPATGSQLDIFAPPVVDDSLVLARNAAEMDDFLDDVELDALEVASVTKSFDPPVDPTDEWTDEQIQDLAKLTAWVATADEAGWTKPGEAQDDVPPDVEPPAELESTDSTDDPALTQGQSDGAVAVAPPEAAREPVVAPIDPIATIKGAKELLDLGILDQAEFDTIKAAQLAVMAGAR